MRILEVFTVLTILATALYATENDDADVSSRFYNELEKYRQTGEVTPELQNLLQKFSFKDSSLRGGFADRMGMCSVCNALVKTVIVLKHSGAPDSEIVDMIEDLCVLLKIETKNVCSGVIASNADIIMYILNNNPNMSAKRVCGLLLQNEEPSCNPNYAIEWSLEVPLGEKPDPITKSLSDNDAETYTLVQISDIHHDPHYKVGGNADCNEPTCCREPQGNPSSPSNAAGYWGDYRSCDIPWHTVEDALNQIRNQHKNINFVYFTGDLVDHGVWETSRDSNKQIFEKFYKTFKEKFPNTPLFPILGNHEPHPLNVYAPRTVKEDSLSTQWLYNVTLSHWLNWLPQDVTSSVLTGGFYTALVKPGLRVVALNNNVCYIYNWWLLDDHGTELLADQLNWLAEVLLKAEKANEKVHILAHIPPGSSDSLNSCSREYRKIINRFENTVMAQFNGHTHNDEFHISYSLEDPKRATNVALNGGSITTYSNLNPNYKIYKVDAATGLIRNSETWIYNLTAANLNGDKSPNWYKLYSFQEDYGVESLVPSELDNLAHKMDNNTFLMQKYSSYFYKNSEEKNNCNSECDYDHLCSIVKDHAADESHCSTIHQ